jgi:hypothetical protein
MAATGSSRLALLAAAAPALLAGCGITLPWYSTPPVEVTVEYAPASLAFAGHLGGAAPPAQTIDVRVRPDWLTWGVGMTYDTQGMVFFSNMTELPDGWRRFELQAVDPNALGEGTFEGALQVFAFTPDDAPVPGSPWSIPVTYRVGPRPITAAPTMVTFEQVLGGAVAPPQVVSLSGPAEGGAWTSELDFYGQAPWLTVTPSSGTTIPADLQLQVSSAVGSTARYLTATLRLRRDGVTAEVLVTLDEHPPGITTSTPELFFTAVEGQAVLPPAQDVVLATDTGAESPFGAWADGFWWLQFPQSGTAPATVPVSVSTATLSPGRYDTELRFQPTWSADPADGAGVLVHYDVLPRALAASPDWFETYLTGDTAPAELSKTVTVTTSSPSLAWTAEPLVAWLEVDPPAGTGPGSFAMSVPVASVPSLASGWQQGRVAVRWSDPVAGTMTEEVLLNLYVLLPSITSLQPRIGLAGAAEPVTVRREGTVADPVISFGGTPAAAVSPQPNGTLLVTPPALAAGRWPVTVRNALGVDWRPVDLDLLAPVSRPGASIASAGRKSSVAFDDGTGMLHVANPGAGRVERYAEAAGWTRAERALPGLKDAVLSPDGRQVVAVTTDGVLTLDAALDGPASTLSGSFASVERPLAWRLAIAADGEGPVVTPDLAGCQGSPDCGIHFVHLPYASFWLGFNGERMDGWRPAAPDDLSSVWLLRHGANVPEPLARYQPWTADFTFEAPVVFDGTALDLDRRGARVLLLDVDPAFAATVGRLADTATGLLPGTLPPTTAAALLSQDGTRAVAFDGVSRTVRIFDLAAPPGGETDPFAEVGTPGGFAPPADPGAEPVLALSVDERTLFLAGDDAVVICPLP